jgi:hypothetical protein
MGWTSRRPDIDLPPIDRAALMRDATARKLRRNFESYREALAYGLSIAWKQINLARSIMMLKAQVAPRSAPLTSAQLEASRLATRRTGSSFIGM